jgi:hypothetical protein
MPNLDQTGPQGLGVQTGRRVGRCSSYGQGFGRDRRRFISSKNELEALEDEEKILEEKLNIIKKEKEALKAQK